MAKTLIRIDKISDELFLTICLSAPPPADDPREKLVGLVWDDRGWQMDGSKKRVAWITYSVFDTFYIHLPERKYHTTIDKRTTGYVNRSIHYNQTLLTHTGRSYFRISVTGDNRVWCAGNRFEAAVEAEASGDTAEETIEILRKHYRKQRTKIDVYKV